MLKEPRSLSPFLFILNQLEAAETARLQEAAEPPKRPRGRPPKIEEPPLLPGAFRHVLSDEDSEFDKQLLRAERASPPTVEPVVTAAVPTKGSLAIIVPNAGKFSCVFNGKVIGTSKHKDYWEYHYARGDLKSAQDCPIGKFVRVTSVGAVECVASAQHLKERGVKGSMLPPSILSTDELIMLAEALNVTREG